MYKNAKKNQESATQDLFISQYPENPFMDKKFVELKNV